MSEADSEADVKMQYCAKIDDGRNLLLFCVTCAVGALATSLNGLARDAEASGRPNI